MNTHCRSGAKQLERICLRMMPNTRFGVFMCVLLSLRFIETLHVGTRVPYTCCGGSIINSHRNPCVSRPEGGVEEGVWQAQCCLGLAWTPN